MIHKVGVYFAVCMTLIWIGLMVAIILQERL